MRQIFRTINAWLIEHIFDPEAELHEDHAATRYRESRR
jgi:hypothetical protein